MSLAGTISVRVVLAVLRAYKLLFSPLFTGSCRYWPSCSDYMAEAVSVHGPVKGLALGTWRLLRCHPLGGHGVDAVPVRPSTYARGALSLVEGRGRAPIE
jgi:putative membrane protein insertion efficiency factor